MCSTAFGFLVSLAVAAGVPSNSGRCETDDDCGPGESCLDGICGCRNLPPSCVEDADCEDGLDCLDHYCLPALIDDPAVADDAETIDVDLEDPMLPAARSELRARFTQVQREDPWLEPHAPPDSPDNEPFGCASKSVSVDPALWTLLLGVPLFVRRRRRHLSALSTT